MPRMNTGESAHDKYSRLITKRLPNALDEIRKVRRLFEGTDYDFTELEAQQVFHSLFEAIKPISPVKIQSNLASASTPLDEETTPQLIGQNKLTATSLASDTGDLAEKSITRTGASPDAKLPEQPREWPDADFKGLTPVAKSELAWSLDMLTSGNVAEARKMLRRVLFSLKDFSQGNLPGTAQRKYDRKA